MGGCVFANIVFDPQTRGYQTHRALYHVAADMLRECCPKAADVWEEAVADAPACLGLSASHWKRLETSSVQERTSRETRRRSRAVQVFPSVKSLERLVGAVMCEQDEEWAGSRCFSERKMAEPCDPSPSPEPAAPEEREKADEMARKAMEASLELADRMEAAQDSQPDSRFWTSARSAGHKARRSLTD